MDERAYWLGFNQCQKINWQRLSGLLKYFNSLESAWKADVFELKNAGIENNVLEELTELKRKFDPEKELENLEKQGIRVLTIKDEEYPKLLSEIFSPPWLLYIRGEIKKEDEFALSVVGTRKMTDYGKQVTEEIAYDLAKSGITIISGLASGIDTCAHKSSLEAGGRTIAVLGSGIDDKSIFPQSNLALASKIERLGAIISEYPPGYPSLRQNFPARNRIVAGLSLGVLVTEAPEDSGALITAKFALEQNREIFAVPGNIYSRNSFGPNNLVKMGAKPVTNFKDILDELSLNLAIDYKKAEEIIAETPEEAKLLEYLSREPMHIDILVQETGFEAGLVNSTLTVMEMKGKVKDLGGMNYILRGKI